MRYVNSCCFAGLLGAAAMSFGPSPALAADTGSIQGQIVFEGEIPDLKPRVVKGDQAAKDAAVCAKDGVPNEAFVIDPETRGVANVMVYLRKAPANMPDSARESATKEVTFDQQGCRYIPHVLAVRTDQTVMCVSSDAVAHNVHTSPFVNQGKNFMVTPNAKEGSPIEMPSVESIPVGITCDIHPWMKAWWVVTDHPYVGITDDKGNFKIDNLPVGKHEFTVWQEEVGYVNRKLTVDVKAGENEVPLQTFGVVQTGDRFKLKK